MNASELDNLLPSKEVRDKMFAQAQAEKLAFWMAVGQGEEVAMAWLDVELRKIWGNDAPFIPPAHEQTH